LTYIMSKTSLHFRIMTFLIRKLPNLRSNTFNLFIFNKFNCEKGSWSKIVKKDKNKSLKELRLSIMKKIKNAIITSLRIPQTETYFKRTKKGKRGKRGKSRRSRRKRGKQSKERGVIKVRDASEVGPIDRHLK
jgi:hypothetical protein